MSKKIKSFLAKSHHPYSKVLEIDASKLVVICGQVGEDENEELVGDTIEVQTEASLKNCQTQLNHAGCSLTDVFKVNIYIANMSDWSRLNAIYLKFFTNEKLPVRTTVQAGLPEGYLVEIEMWATKA
ncbi:MAG: RidA family protein [Treponemataceae bacterium]